MPFRSSYVLNGHFGLRELKLWRWTYTFCRQTLDVDSFSCQETETDIYVLNLQKDRETLHVHSRLHFECEETSWSAHCWQDFNHIRSKRRPREEEHWQRRWKCQEFTLEILQQSLIWYACVNAIICYCFCICFWLQTTFCQHACTLTIEGVHFSA